MNRVKKYFSFILIVLSFANFCNGQNYFEDASKEYFNGDLNKSIELFTISIKNNQETAKSYMYRGAAKSFLKMFDEALKDLNLSKDKDSSNTKLYYYYGKLYLFKGDLDLAIKYYDNAVSKNPKDAFSYDERAIAKGLVNDFAGAIADENIAIAIDSTIQEFYTDRGFAKLKLKEYNEAIKDFNTSLKIMPNQKAYADRGVAYSLLSQHKRAIEDYTKSLEFNSNDSEVYYYRGISHEAMGNKRETCTDLKRSSELGYAKAYDVLKKMICD